MVGVQRADGGGGGAEAVLSFRVSMLRGLWDRELLKYEVGEGEDGATQVGDGTMAVDEGAGGEGEDGEGEEIVWEDNSVMVSISILLRFMSRQAYVRISPSLHTKSPSLLYLGTQRSH